MRGVVNQLLVELDGASTNNAGVFTLAASNHPWDVDEALLRPGRFDRSIFVAPPDLAAREAILRLHLQGKPSEQLDPAKIAKITEGRSGADLALICDSAAEHALEASLHQGTVVPISQKWMLDAVRSTKSSIRPWIETAKSFANFGNASGAYDELAEFLRIRRS
jgi:SpoVK/Ycf46/Vps4 family AAA+-type ATPase